MLDMHNNPSIFLSDTHETNTKEADTFKTRKMVLTLYSINYI